VSVLGQKLRKQISHFYGSKLWLEKLDQLANKNVKFKKTIILTI